MAKKQKVVSKKEDDSKLFAFIATFFSIVGFIIAIIVKRDNKYVMHYAKQSLVVFVTSILLSIIGAILSAIFYFPIYAAVPGTIGAPTVFSGLASLFSFILWLFSWIYALSGEMKEVPVVGHFGRKFNL